ncbi:ester cyclase [Streptomyces chartreusis]|uniref:ester cyclase n=1 Tax=Streptomyces chartreusis TaxID=1969 RepID=UPI0036946B3E
MTTASELYRRIVEDVVGRGDLELANKLFADDFVGRRTGLHTFFTLFAGPPPRQAAEMSGKQMFMGGLSRIKASFPDWACSVHYCVAENDLVSGAFTVSGSFTGTEAFLGFPPNGNEFRFEEAGMLRVRDGQAVEAWFVGDELAFAHAIAGLAPALTAQNGSRTHRKATEATEAPH